MDLSCGAWTDLMGKKVSMKENKVSRLFGLVYSIDPLTTEFFLQTCETLILRHIEYHGHLRRNEGNFFQTSKGLLVDCQRICFFFFGTFVLGKSFCFSSCFSSVWSVRSSVQTNIIRKSLKESFTKFDIGIFPLKRPAISHFVKI